MAWEIHGLHHVTGICGGAQRNVDFYAKVLGLRFLKKTVNFDDPGTYHLYYGDTTGSPGSAMTFFPWERLPRGRDGVGHASITQFAVPDGSLGFWRRRLEAAGATIRDEERLFGEARILLEDPDGLGLALVVPAAEDDRAPWTGGTVGAEAAIRGFHGVTLTLADHQATARLLTELLGYRLEHEEGSTRRYLCREASHARVVDIVERPEARHALQGVGTIHHIAFAVPDETQQEALRRRLAAEGLGVTPIIDRTYFRSIYFRTPGDVLFEVATEAPGFTIDESVEELGSSLRLPPQHEHLRAELERRLPPLSV